MASCSTAVNQLLFNIPQARQVAYAIPSGVITIGDAAFYFSLGLTNVTIPNGVSKIGLESFYDSENLIAINIPNTVTNIGDWAFWSCSSLNTVTIPASVTSVGGFAFLYCVGLSAVYFGGNAPTDGGGIFDNDTGVTVYYLPGSTGWDAIFGDAPTVEETPPDEFTYVTNSDAVSITVTGYTGLDDVVAIPPNINGYPVNSIGAQTFQDHGVANVLIPNSITSIGESAFAGCANLDSIVIPNSVTNIADYAFSPCTNLTAGDLQAMHRLMTALLFIMILPLFITCLEQRVGAERLAVLPRWRKRRQRRVNLTMLRITTRLPSQATLAPAALW